MELKKRKMLVIDVMNHTGEVRIEAMGFKGKSCLKDEVANFIQESLGQSVSQELKPEYYEKEEEKTTILRSFCG